MRDTHSGVWFSAGLGLVASVIQLARAYSALAARLYVFDWILVVLILIGPLFVVRRYLRQMGEVTDDTLNTGRQIAMMGYVPLWIGITLVERVIGRF